MTWNEIIAICARLLENTIVPYVCANNKARKITSHKYIMYIIKMKNIFNTRGNLAEKSNQFLNQEFSPDAREEVIEDEVSPWLVPSTPELESKEEFGTSLLQSSR
jgi:hypothetical protein